MNFFNIEEGEKIRYRVSLFWDSGEFDRYFFAHKGKAQDFFAKRITTALSGQSVHKVVLYKEFGDGAMLAEWNKGART